MGLIDFFKKIGKNKGFEGLDSAKNQKEEVLFNNIQEWINKKEEETKEKEKEIINLIKEKIPVAEKEINEKLEKLSSTEVASQKAEGRVETIVKENLENYINHVKTLVKKLSEIKEKDYENINELINEINGIFSYFEKKSYMNYQKATHLVKKELIETNKSVMNLSKELKQIFDKHKKTIDYSGIIYDIKEKLSQMNQTNENILGMKKNVSEIDKTIEELNKRKEKLSEEIEKIKNSEEYKKNLEKKEKLKSLKQELKKEIFALKEKIDFKKLANNLHNDKKRLDIVKSFKEEFYNKFINQREILLGLISDAGMKNSEIDKKTDKIKEKEEEIEELEKGIKEDRTEKIDEEIKKIKEEIEKLNSEKEKKEKNLEKPQGRVHELFSNIKERVSELGGELKENEDNPEN